MNWTDVYTAYLEADWREHQKTRSQDTFHASDIGYCPRKAIWSRAGLVFMPDPGKLRRFRQGTLLHNDWEHGLVEAIGESVQTEVSLAGYLPEGWDGTSDLVYLDEGGEIDDFKTVNPNAFRYASEFPKDADCLQLGLYWGGYERKAGVTLAGGKIIYIPMGVFDPPIECEVSPLWKDEALRRAAAFDHYWEEYQADGTLPDPPEPVLKTSKKEPSGHWEQNWECSPAFCAFAYEGHCKGGPCQP